MTFRFRFIRCCHYSSPACKKHEFKKHQTLIFKIIFPLMRNWCKFEKAFFLFKSYAYIRNLKSVKNSALQFNQTVHIQMKTRILHANEAKSTFRE